MSVPNKHQKGAFLIPAYNPGPLLEEVLAGLLPLLEEQGLDDDVPVLVVDDGCTDGSCEALPERVTVLRNETNQGKGAALQKGLRWAREANLDFLVTLDADNQHPVDEAVRLYQMDSPEGALVLAVRDMKGAGAPRPSQLSNAFSNWVLSQFGGERLYDTQCGLRKYPVAATLALGASHPGYAFESECVLLAARKGLPIVHVSARVHYPDEASRVSHFDSVKDPAKNVLRVVQTAFRVPHHRASRRWGRRMFVILLAALGVWLWFF